MLSRHYFSSHATALLPRHYAVTPPIFSPQKGNSRTAAAAALLPLPLPLAPRYARHDAAASASYTLDMPLIHMPPGLFRLCR